MRRALLPARSCPRAPSGASGSMPTTAHRASWRCSNPVRARDGLVVELGCGSGLLDETPARRRPSGDRDRRVTRDARSRPRGRRRGRGDPPPHPAARSDPRADAIVSVGHALSYLPNADGDRSRARRDRERVAARRCARDRPLRPRVGRDPHRPAQQGVGRRRLGDRDRVLSALPRPVRAPDGHVHPRGRRLVAARRRAPRQRDGRHLARAGPARRARRGGDRRTGVRGRDAARRPPCASSATDQTEPSARVASEPEASLPSPSREIHRSDAEDRRRTRRTAGRRPRVRATRAAVSSSPAISTLAIPVTSTSWWIAVRPGCSSAGTSHAMKNGSHESREPRRRCRRRATGARPRRVVCGRRPPPCSPSRGPSPRARYPPGRWRTTGLARRQTTLDSARPSAVELPTSWSTTAMSSM